MRKNLILILCLFHYTATKTITIDTSVSSDTATTVSKLENAIPLIVNPATQQFYELNNTIIFSTNTVNTTQLMKNFNVTGPASGGLSLIFAGTISRPTQATDCNAFPTILLSQNVNSSFIVATDISYFFIQGIKLAIFVNNSNQILSFNDLTNVTIDSVCFEDLDTSYSFTLPMESSSVTSFVLTNSLFLYTVQPMILFSGLSVANISSIKIIIQPYPSSSIYAGAILFFRGVGAQSVLNATDVHVTCMSQATPRQTQTALRLSTFFSVRATLLRLDSCYFADTLAQTFFWDLTTYFYIDNVVVTNLTVDITALNTIGYGLIGFLGIINAFLSNMSFTNIQGFANTEASAQQFSGLTFYPNDASPVYPTNTQFTNLTFSDSNYFGKTSLIVIYGYQFAAYPASNVIENVSFIRTNFTLASVIRLFPKDGGYSDAFDLQLYDSILFKNLTIDTCILNGTTIVFLDSEMQNAFLVEFYAFIFQGISILNSQFKGISGGSYDGFDMVGAQLWMYNLVAKNNTISVCSFAVALVRMGTFMLSDSVIDGLTLDQGGSFLGYSLDQSVYISLDYAFTDTVNKIFFIETRPFMVKNCTFQNIIVKDGSYLIQSHNPMIILSNNSFINITSDSSSIFEFGKYELLQPLPAGYSVGTSASIENQIFRNFTAEKQLFLNARANLSSYRSTGETYTFIVIENSFFCNITSTNEAQIFNILDMTVESSMAGLFGNVIQNIWFQSDKAFSIVNLDEVDEVVVLGNTFKNASGAGEAVSLSATSLENVQLISNSFENFTTTRGYQIQSSVCGNITFDADSATGIMTENTWMEIVCQAISGVFYFQNSAYADIAILSTKNQLLSLSFMELQIQQVTSSSPSIVTFSLNTFKNITLDMSIQTYALDVFISSVFQFQLSNIAFTVNNNSFNQITNVGSGRILSISANEVSFANDQLASLSYCEPTGAIYVITKAMVISNSTFVSNNGMNSRNISSVFISLEDPLGNGVALMILNSNFTNNSALSASLISVQSVQLALSVVNTIISDNFGTDAAAISLIGLGSSSLFFANMTFEFTASSSTLWSASDILEVQDGTANISLSFINCTVRTYRPISGYLASLSQNQYVFLNITNLSYDLSNETTSGQSLSAFGILKADKVDAHINALSVKAITFSSKALFELTCTYEGQIFSPSLNVHGSNFSQLQLTGSPLIRLSLDNSASNYFCNSSISLTSSNFTDISSASDGLIIYSDSSQMIGQVSNSVLLNISNCRFDTLTATRGCVYFGQRLYYGADLSFENSSFTNINASQEGGIIFIQNTNPPPAAAISQIQPYRRMAQASSSSYPLEYLEINRCNFTNISSVMGGVIYNYYSNPYGSITLQDSIFQKIDVTGWGAVVYTSNSAFIADNNTFNATQAAIAGSIIYSDSIQLDFTAFQSQNQLFQVNGSTIISYSPNSIGLQFTPAGNIIVSEDGNILTVQNLSSYSLQDITITATLIYQDDQSTHLVIPDGSDANIAMTFNLQGDVKILPFDCPMSTSMISCDLNASKITLTGNKSSLIPVNVIYTSNGTLQYSANRTFFIELRGCIPGEINNTITEVCDPCGAGTYSFNASDKHCLNCPDGAICNGGTNLSINPGYWRANSTSSNVIACNGGTSRCIGDNYCSPEFTGPVCLQCNPDNRYLSQSNGECSQCATNAYLIGVGIGMFIISIIFQVFSLSSAFQKSQKDFEAKQTASPTISSNNPQELVATDPAPYIEIFTTYSQMTSIFSEMVGGFLNRIFDVPATVGNPNQKVFSSLQCLLFLVSKDQLVILKYKTIFFVLSPLAKIVIYVMLELIRGTIKGFQKKELAVRVGAVMIGLSCMEQPQIIGVLCDYLSCARLDQTVDTLYVASNPSIQCGTQDYILFRNFFVLPALMIWGFLLPLTLIFILAKKKSELMESRSLYVIFGKLYDSYTAKAYFWGLVVIIFKITMFVLNSMLKPYTLGRGVVLVLVVHGYWLMFKRFKPHPHKDLARADHFTIRAFMWTILFVLLIDQIQTSGVQIFS